MTNPVTKDRRHFEDLRIGEVIDLGHVTVTKEMIVTFAREFDPFPFHLDEAAAKQAKEEAEKLLLNRTDALEIAEAQAQLAQALAQLQALERLRKNLKH